MEKLKQFKTYELLDELKLREGVETHVVEPYDIYNLPTVEGAAIILTIID